MSAPRNVLVFALLMLDLNRSGASTKSIWFCTCPFGACKVTALDSLCGCFVFARVSRWLIANSRSLNTLSLGSPKPKLPTVPYKSLNASGPTLAFQSPWILRMSSYGTLTMMRSISL
ncbi:hypothetical protein DPMN_111448 [Dreissena polymorpha]|uniref:Secreted protein n=1 Tax=Dreissena polymorpha TaxID=45954 RepID=A0A9D4KDX6_DREPO|nr:hypothetical protein DPMN_111448 [Dreissena polymorpha]